MIRWFYKEIVFCNKWSIPNCLWLLATRAGRAANSHILSHLLFRQCKKKKGGGGNGCFVYAVGVSLHHSSKLLYKFLQGGDWQKENSEMKQTGNFPKYESRNHEGMRILYLQHRQVLPREEPGLPPAPHCSEDKSDFQQEFEKSICFGALMMN